MRTEEEIREQLNFLKKDVRKNTETNNEKIALENQIYMLEWVLENEE